MTINPETQEIFLDSNDEQEALERTSPLFISDIASRLGRVEMQNNKILPMLGKVAEALNNLETTMQDVKSDFKNTRDEFASFRLGTADYGTRITKLEEAELRIDTNRFNDLQEAKSKAESLLDERCREERKTSSEKRNRILTTIAGAIGTIAVTAILTWLGLK